jgi:beta-galactosidase
VKNGGHLVLAFKSGFCDEYSTVRWTRAPGPLREAAGFSYQEFANLKQPLALEGDPFRAGTENKVSTWADFVMPETARVLASYDHPFYGRFAAITRNTFGRGTVTYEGTVLSNRLQERLLADVVELAGVGGPDQQIAAPVRVQNGVSNAGKPMHFYLNYSSESQSFTYPHADGTDLLTKKPVGKGRRVTLGPWDLAIVREK